MKREILATKTLNSNGFEFVLNVLSYAENGWSMFNDKWTVDPDGPVKGSDCNFTCDWYTIGKDCTVEQAQTEFDRDVYAFDVNLNVTVKRNGVVLVDNYPVIGGDYNIEEDSKQLLEDLEGHFSLEDFAKMANEELETMRKALA
ncbi:hypothetical protein [Vibrio phage RYC]|nr:hypothetical protein [Vibrio phage RYC]